MKTTPAIYGLMAEFEEPHRLLEAAERAYAAGYRRMDGFSPFPMEGLAEALGCRKSRVPLFVLLGGVLGGASGYFMEYYAMVVDYPLNIGGRPFHSWPSFIPITFELTVLGGALAALISMLVLNRLPEPYHPVFNVPEFARASADRFFLCIESDDPMFDSVQTRRFLAELNPQKVMEVER